MPLSAYITAAIAMGLVTEALAYALSLWWYHKAWMRIPNVLLVFGLIYGALSWATAKQGMMIQFASGAAIGLFYEWVNDRWLKIWHFPGEPWTFLRGQRAVIGVGLSWGLVPVILAVLVPIL